MAITKFKGVSMELADGVVYVIPALTLRHVQAMQARLNDFTGGVDAGSLEVVIDTVQLALTRNYPALTRDEVSDLIDLRNMDAVMKAVMGASGMVEASPSGEAAAVA